MTLQRIYLAANINPYILFEIVDLDLPKIISHKLIILHELNKIDICDVCGSYTCPDCPVNNNLTSSSKSIHRYLNLIFSFISFFVCSHNFLNSVSIL